VGFRLRWELRRDKPGFARGYAATSKEANSGFGEGGRAGGLRILLRGLEGLIGE